MAHYAFLDENNVVTEVIVGRDEWDVVDGVSDWEAYYGRLRGQRCVRTSYNGNIRKRYAGVGFVYDEQADVFIEPRAFDSWRLDENFDWQPPTPKPDDGLAYWWDEKSLSWVRL